MNDLDQQLDRPVSRRDLIGLLGTGVVFLSGAGLLPGGAQAATDDEVTQAMKDLIGEKTAIEQGVTLGLPEIAENGNTVPVKVAVDHPMVSDDYVTHIHVIATGNPFPTVASFALTPSCGQAEISFRMRLAKTQNIIALAETSSGAAMMAKKEIKVTIGGCGG